MPLELLLYSLISVESRKSPGGLYQIELTLVPMKVAYTNQALKDEVAGYNRDWWNAHPELRTVLLGALGEYAEFPDNT